MGHGGSRATGTRCPGQEERRRQRPVRYFSRAGSGADADEADPDSAAEAEAAEAADAANGSCEAVPAAAGAPQTATASRGPSQEAGGDSELPCDGLAAAARAA